MKEFAQYQVNSNSVIQLNQFDCRQNHGLSDKQLKQKHKSLMNQIVKMQNRLYAEGKQSLLIVLQAMDAAGKDSTIYRLTKGLNAQGCHVHSFKAPTKKELAHDFLWRVHACTPAAGEIAIFNRSHYEDVLIVKVRGWMDGSMIQARYRHINQFEALLRDRGTHILKFMLHVSPEYQLQRFRSRLENSDKLWKFNPGDLDERALWDQYMRAFEAAMKQCATKTAPWYIVPAENRRFRDYMIASIVREKLQQMNPQYPAAEFDLEDYPPESLF